VSAGTPQFSYRAAHQSGLLETGTVRAESAEAARELLFSRGLFPLEVRQERGREAGRPRMSTPDMALGLRVMSSLLESGLPVARALAARDTAWAPRVPPRRWAFRRW
jgi:type II secretory pathway component PulF